ncbi:MAG: sugar phosphate nucleotidyltransferase [Candidatus Pacebacteria bacterium]|nr:sugar phosphate nucleotidyltransferase [Candidatus Paceibacterota bacterium]
MADIKKAIIPVGGLGTRFLPLSKAVPKELWPLADEPVIQKIITEVKNSDIDEIIFVLGQSNKKILEYLKPSLKIEKILKERKKEKLLAEFKEFEDLLKSINFSYVVQKNPLGDGHAVLQAAKLAGSEPVGCLFADDVVDSETPVMSQLTKVFKTCQKPVLALYRLPKDKISSYGAVSVEKIASRLFKIKGIVEKPEPENAPSDLVIVGKYILTPEVFGYLKKAKPGPKGEIILAEVLDKMIKDGKLVYGYEIEGKWLECGNKLSWLKSNIYFSLKHPKFGPEIKQFLKEIEK